MNAVIARIFGLAGSGGALRWAWTQAAKKIKAEQRRTGKRKLPRRMGDLQMGRSGAGHLQDTGFGGGRDAGFWRCVVQLAQHAAPLQRSTTQRGRLNERGDAGDALAYPQLVDIVVAFLL